MEIEKNIKESELSVAVKGRIDTMTAPQLEQELSLDGITSLVFDLVDVDYVSSAGLRLFLSSHKQMMKQGGKMVLRHLRPVVREVFDLTGFSDILNLEE